MKHLSFPTNMVLVMWPSFWLTLDIFWKHTTWKETTTLFKSLDRNNNGSLILAWWQENETHALATASCQEVPSSPISSLFGGYVWNRVLLRTLQFTLRTACFCLKKICKRYAVFNVFELLSPYFVRCPAYHIRNKYDYFEFEIKCCVRLNILPVQLNTSQKNAQILLWLWTTNPVLLVNFSKLRF